MILMSSGVMYLSLLYYGENNICDVKALSHGAIFLATWNAILLLGDVS